MKPSDWFYLQRSDRRVLLMLMAIGIGVIAILRLGREVPPPPIGSLSDSTSAQGFSNDTVLDVILHDEEERKVERFPFDPNTADSAELSRLGLRPWQVRNILRYRARGGVYSSKEDFARVYGLTVKQYRELEPYIRIGFDYLPAAVLVGNRRRGDALTATADSASGAHGEPARHYRQKLLPGETISLADADTSLLQRVPGIGSYFAKRIAAYGERLGGYVSTSQLLEINDFPADALPFFTADSASVRRLNVNTLSIDALRRHPYISYYQARAIDDYRRLHGPITDLSQLRLLPQFLPGDIERLRPYVKY